MSRTDSRSDLMALADQATLIVYNCTGKIEHQWQRQLIEKINKALRLAASQPDREALAAAVRGALVENWKDDFGATWNEDVLLTGCRRVGGGSGYQKPEEAAQNLALDAADKILSLLSGAGTKSDGGACGYLVRYTANGADHAECFATFDRAGTYAGAMRECGYRDVSLIPLYDHPSDTPIADSSEAGTRPCEFCGSTDTADSKSHCEACAHAAPVGEPMPRGGAAPDWWAESIKLYRQNKLLRKALQEQHDWHLAQGEKDFVEGITLNMADEYSDIGMCERTTAALDAVLPSGIEGYEKWKEQTTVPPAPAVGPDVREAMARAIEGIILRRMHEKRIEGYTLEMSLEQADAILSALTRPLGGFVQGSITDGWQRNEQSAPQPSLPPDVTDALKAVARPIATAPRDASEVFLISFQEQTDGLIYISAHNGCWSESEGQFVLGPRGSMANSVGDGVSTHWIPVDALTSIISKEPAR